jgi:hypothetical protein
MFEHRKAGRTSRESGRSGSESGRGETEAMAGPIRDRTPRNAFAAESGETGCVCRMISPNPLAACR